MRLRKQALRATLGVLCLVLAMQAANAWIIPALMATGRFLAAPIGNTVIWLGRAGAANPTMAKAVEWSITAHAAVIGALWFGKSDQAPTQTIEAKLVVAPNKDQPTVNPDPKKFDDAASASDPLQPAPKSSFSSAESSTQAPSDYKLIVQQLGGAGETGWYQYNVNNDVRYMSVMAPDYVQNGTTFKNSCNAPALNTYPEGYTAKGWCGQVTGIATVANYQVYYQMKPRTCPTGYTLSSGNCVLTDAAQVSKPAGTVSCEVTRKSDNTWYIDPKNPECASLASAITQSEDKKKITINNGSGQSATITERDDGGRDYDIQDHDTWRTIKTGPYDSGLGGRPIQSITDGGGSNPNGTAGGGGTGGNSGGNSGSGSGGSCGGTGQPACSIDDSGFDGKPVDGDGLAGKVDAHDQSIKDKLSTINAGDKHGMDWTWLPSIPRVACTPFEFGTSGKVMTVDMCSTFSVIRQALGWLLYIFMAWGLFDLLISGTTSKGKK